MRMGRIAGGLLSAALLLAGIAPCATADANREALMAFIAERIGQQNVSIAPRGAKAADEIGWKAFIAERFPLQNVPYALRSAMEALQELPGVALNGELEAQGYTLRTHYACFDGVSLVVLYSLTASNPDAEHVFTMDFYTELMGQANFTRDGVLWADTQENAVYGIAHGRIVDDDGAVSPEGMVELLVAPAQAAGQSVHIALLSPGEPAQVALDTELATPPSAAKSLVVHGITEADGVLTVDYTLQQKAADARTAYLMLLVLGEDPQMRMVPLNTPRRVNGRTQLKQVLDGDSPVFLQLISDDHLTLSEALFTGWSLSLPLPDYDAERVQRVPLYRQVSFVGVAPVDINTLQGRIAYLSDREAYENTLADTTLLLREAVVCPSGMTVTFELMLAGGDAEGTNPDAEGLGARMSAQAEMNLSALQRGLTVRWEADDIALQETENGYHSSVYGDGTVKIVGTSAVMRYFETPPETVTLTVSHPQFAEGELQVSIIIP